MKRHELTAGIFHLRSGSNMGLVVRDGKALLIDTGRDADAGRRTLRNVEALGVALEAVFITHAHADHFGGAHFLQRRLGVPVYAPALEAAMMENPIIEPLYFFGGAAPIEELRHKSVLARPCQVDHMVEPGPLEIGPFQVEIVPLKGHALNQMGLAMNDVLFCGDTLWSIETLQKHKVPFCVDLDETLETLQRLPDMPYIHFAPGHGPDYRAGEEIARICSANRERLEEIRSLVYTALERPQGSSDLIQQIANHFGLQLKMATLYFFIRTTILAALSSLERAGEVKPVMEENRLLWQRR